MSKVEQKLMQKAKKIIIIITAAANSDRIMSAAFFAVECSLVKQRLRHIYAACEVREMYTNQFRQQ